MINIRELLVAQPLAMSEGSLRQLISAAAKISPEALQARQGSELDGAQRNLFTERAKAHVRDGVAILEVVGPVFHHSSFITELLDAYFGVVLLDRLALDLNRALDDPKVKAIVLHVDSPGGVAFGNHEFGEMVFNGRNRKPIVSYISGYGASAGYWIASGASEIVADRLALAGSIGTVIAVEKSDDECEVLEIVSAKSPRKRLDPWSDEGRSELQQIVDNFAEVFISTVARNRGVAQEVVEAEFGQGGVFDGARAVAVGMADRLGSLEEVVSQLSAGQWTAPRKDTQMSRRTVSVPGAAGAAPPVTADAEPARPKAEDVAAEEPEKEKEEEDEQEETAASESTEDETEEDDEEEGDAPAASVSSGVIRVPGNAPAAKSPEQQLADARAELAALKDEKLVSQAKNDVAKFTAAMKLNDAEAKLFERRLVAARRAGDTEAEADLLAMLDAKPVIAPSGRLPKAAAVASDNTDIHATITQKLIAQGLSPASPKWGKAYRSEWIAAAKGSVTNAS
jgi:signal peptide peptidase SppA